MKLKIMVMAIASSWWEKERQKGWDSWAGAEDRLN
jgi:hypothetical protein